MLFYYIRHADPIYVPDSITEHDRKRRCYEATAPNDKRVAFFAHGGFGMAFLAVF